APAGHPAEPSAVTSAPSTTPQQQLPSLPDRLRRLREQAEQLTRDLMLLEKEAAKK
ncbi:MAG: hypothetical protein HY238_26620, partial [Acidobacteria bacterium]|nr:hypothetical protein [Acidobacteriota bacterium]